MIYFFYDIFLFLAALLYLPFYAFRGRLHGEILTRLGFFKKGRFRDFEGQDVVWLHAVSVGEARAAESLLHHIRREWPQKRVVVSTVTPTGQAIVRAFLKETEAAFYAPLDISFIVKKFLGALRPGLLIIMETEIWPNLIRLAKAGGCRVVIVNGRMSENSFRGYCGMKVLLAPVLRQVDLFCMQTQEARARLLTLGAPEQKIRLTGNIKFDLSSNEAESAAVRRLKEAYGRCLLFLAGSTHDHEEETLLEIARSCVKDFPVLRLAIAPRHVERADKIRRMARLHGFEPVIFSSFSGRGGAERRETALSAAQVLIIDTIGDLASLYRLSDIAFVGGSLVKKGGHNPIEPALFGKAILFGNHMENFREIRDIFLKEEAALEVDGPQRLEYELRRLLGSPSLREELGGRARQLLEKNKGASRKTLAALKEVVG